MTEKYEVGKWMRDSSGHRTYRGIWNGHNIRQAYMQAGNIFMDELIEAQYPKDAEYMKLKSHREFMVIDFSGKIPCRITILKVISPRREADGKLPEILYSLGDETIEIFQRCHHD